MKTRILLITLALLAVKTGMAQTNYAAAIANNSGTFISEYHYNDQQTSVYAESANGWTNQINYDILDWQNGASSTRVSGSYAGWEFPQSWQDLTAWPTNSWPQVLPDGTTAVTLGANSPGTNAAAPPVLIGEHSDFNKSITGNTTERRTADTEMKLATGGPPGSTQQNLWCITANATDEDTGLPIPPEELQIGSLGTLNANGELWVLLPDNDPRVVTTKPLKPRKHYTFNVGANYYPLSIAANQTRLYEKVVANGADFCVGQAIYFNVVGLPNRPWLLQQYEYKAVWTLPGNYVNRQPNANCLAYYDTNTDLLTRSSVTDGGLTTYAWYVKDLQPATVSVKVSQRLGNSPWYDLQTITGQFNVHRPTTQFTPPGINILDGLPTVLVVGGVLTLGNGRINDMSFQHQINPGNFSGTAGYTQLISGEYTEFNTTDVPITIGGTVKPDTELDKQEYIRGQSPIATNAYNPVSFWDGPFEAMYKGIAEENLVFDDYLLFMPNGGPGPNIYVPLRRVHWELHDSAIGGAVDSGNVVGPADNDCTTFPSWTKTFSRWWN